MSIFVRKHSIHSKIYLMVSGGGFFCREGYRRIEKCFSLCSIIPYCFIIPPFTLHIICHVKELVCMIIYKQFYCVDVEPLDDATRSNR